ncbi:hypothetical protein D3C85_1544550 [compost metagenome]
MLDDRIAQHRQQPLHLLLAEQIAVGLQQRPVDGDVILHRFWRYQLPVQHLAQIVQLQWLGQHAIHTGIQITAY